MEILFRDDHFVAVNKPSGLLVHRSEIDRHETRFAVQEVRNLIGRRVYPVHRLDKATSGVLIFGLHEEAARALGAAFTRKAVDKRYLCVVRGIPQAEGCIDHPLVERPDKMERGGAEKPPQPAVTAFRRLSEVELPVAVDRYPTSRYALLETRPYTGRKHQIRRHLKHIFHPIVGDTSYGHGPHNRFFRERFDSHRMLLTAVQLSFIHPLERAKVTIGAPLDATFRRVVEALGWTAAVEERYPELDPHRTDKPDAPLPLQAGKCACEGG